jgi:hypothetical protein
MMQRPPVQLHQNYIRSGGKSQEEKVFLLTVENFVVVLCVKPTKCNKITQKLLTKQHE